MSNPTNIRWDGHASFRITSPEGVVVLIDPWITENPSCPIKLNDVTSADLILVTHDHFDHSSDAVAIAKRTGATVIGMPETVGRLQLEAGLPAENVLFDGIGMNIGGRVTVKGISVVMVQAFHSSQTGSPCGYMVILEDGTTIYHAGDTGLFQSMELFKRIYHPHVALLPIGSVFTMDPAQAACALALLDPEVCIPMHFGTFPILEQDARTFADLAAKEAEGVNVVVLDPGGEYTLPLHKTAGGNR